MTVPVFASVQGRSDQFERCVLRVRDTSGEGQGGSTKCGRMIARAYAKGPNEPPGPPCRRPRHRASRHRRGSMLRIRPAPSLRWYPQSAKRTPRTRPAHDARATTVMYIKAAIRLRRLERHVFVIILVFCVTNSERQASSIKAWLPVRGPGSQGSGDSAGRRDSAMETPKSQRLRDWPDIPLAPGRRRRPVRNEANSGECQVERTLRNEPNSLGKREPGDNRLGSFVRTQGNCSASSYPSHGSYRSPLVVRTH